MQTRNPFFDDMAKAMESAVGLAQAAGEEAKAAFRAQGDRLVAEFDLVRRDEFDAMRAVLTAEIEALRAEVAGLHARLAPKPASDQVPAFGEDMGPVARPAHDGG